MISNDELIQIAGTDLFGVANAAAYADKAPTGHRPVDFLKGARSIVVIGTRMLDTPLDGLPGTRTEYTANFHVVNNRLNEKIFELAGFLESRSQSVFPVPYTEVPGWNLENRSPLAMRLMRPFLTRPQFSETAAARLWEKISYRHAAVEAGLGEIGVNNLFLSREHGPRVRLAALLTDAELEFGKPLNPENCRPELCGYACVKACPAEALSRDGGPTNKAACLKYYLKLGIPGVSGVRCGLCVSRCPASGADFRNRS